MDTTAFDGIVRELGAVSTRRGFTRILGGAVALGAGLALGGESLAKGKGRDNARSEARGNERVRPRRRRARRSPSATRTRRGP